MTDDVKYYVYISDVKVDMLFSQISNDWVQRISGELKINLGVIGAGLNVKEPKEPDRYSKLKVVLNYLDKKGEIGSIEDPKNYFQGSLSMAWEDLGFVEHPFAYFSGISKATVVGLGGSMKHIIGTDKLPQQFIPGESNSPFLLKALQNEAIQRDIPNGVDLPQSMFYIYSEMKKDYDGSVAATQQMEFCAKKIFQGPLDSPLGFSWEPKKVLLGTPIYVAITQ